MQAILSQLATTIITSLISGSIVFLWTRGKLKAETESIVTNTYNRLVLDLRSEIDRLKTQVSALETREAQDHRTFETERQQLMEKMEKLQEENYRLFEENICLKKELAEIRLRIEA